MSLGEKVFDIFDKINEQFGVFDKTMFLAAAMMVLVVSGFYGLWLLPALPFWAAAFAASLFIGACITIYINFDTFMGKPSGNLGFFATSAFAWIVCTLSLALASMPLITGLLTGFSFVGACAAIYLGFDKLIGNKSGQAGFLVAVAFAVATSMAAFFFTPTLFMGVALAECAVAFFVMGAAWTGIKCGISYLFSADTKSNKADDSDTATNHSHNDAPGKNANDFNADYQPPVKPEFTSGDHNEQRNDPTPLLLTNSPHNKEFVIPDLNSGLNM